AQAAWKLAEGRTFEQLHVWPRDRLPAGKHGFAPGFTDESRAAEEALVRHAPPEILVGKQIRPPAREGEMVFDCVMVEPNEWWVGYHRAASRASHWAGGMRDVQLPSDALSRAYLKM